MKAYNKLLSIFHDTRIDKLQRKGLDHDFQNISY